MSETTPVARRLDEARSLISAFAGDGLKTDAALDSYTSFRIGGPADLLLEPSSPQVLSRALEQADRLDIPVTMLGGGTNVLVADGGVRGLVVRFGKAFNYTRWGQADEAGAVVVEAGAAVRLARLVRESVQKGLGGLEFAAGIPGSVGGGTLMNAGAFGGEIGDAIEAVQVCTRGGEIVDMDRSRLPFSYRKLALGADVMIISVRFRLLRSPLGRLKAAVERVQAKRKTKQPGGLPNAGSVFKNPHGEFAGRLIERAGLKGLSVGDAQVSPEHANFIVNLGGARACEVRDLMSLVQEAVWKKCGVWLEPEVRLIGAWDET